MSERLRFSTWRDEWALVGFDGEPLEQPFSLETIGNASLASVRRAMQDYVGIHPAQAPARFPERPFVRMVDLPPELQRTQIDLSPSPEDVDGDERAWEPTSIRLAQGAHLQVRVEVALDTVDDDDMARVKSVLRPLLKRRKASFLSSEVMHDFPEGGGVIEVLLEPPVRGQTIHNACELGNAVERLLRAATPGARLSPDTAADLIRAGHAELLLGQLESDWLDAKRAPPALRNEVNKLELAKDVAALANGKGGLLVHGLGTKRSSEGDVIESAHPFPATRFSPTRIRRVLDTKVFPPVEGLEVSVSHDAGKGCFGLIRVPPQPFELRPYLVRGAIVDGKIVGTHIAVFERRGDDTDHYAAERIHALMSAGRAALASSRTAGNSAP